MLALRTPEKVTEVFLVASNLEKLLGTIPAPPLCLASFGLYLGRKAFGSLSPGSTMYLATSVGWLHLGVQAEDHHSEEQVHGHECEDHMDPLEARSCPEVHDNQPCLEFLAGPGRHRHQLAPWVQAFQSTQEDQWVLVDHFYRLDLVVLPTQICHEGPLDPSFQEDP